MKKSSLVTKLVSVMKEVDRVPKNGRNEFHGYNYALEADIVDAVRGKLADLGVFISTSIQSAARQGELTQVTTTHTFHDAETGETLALSGYGQGLDRGDKGGYKAITGAIKYFLLKNFLIATGDDPERDEPQQARGRSQPGKNGKAPEPATAAQLKLIATLAAEIGMDVPTDIYAKMGIQDAPTKRQATAIIGRLQELKHERQQGAMTSESGANAPR